MRFKCVLSLLLLWPLHTSGLNLQAKYIKEQRLFSVEWLMELHPLWEIEAATLYYKRFKGRVLEHSANNLKGLILNVDAKLEGPIVHMDCVNSHPQCPYAQKLVEENGAPPAYKGLADKNGLVKIQLYF